MPYGRGGAGNLWQADVEQKKATEDVEAQHPINPINPSNPASGPPTASSLDSYAHSGRGGAGNWYSPTLQRATGTFTNDSAGPSTSSSPAATSVPKSPAPTTNFGGRGGAGNYNWEQVEAEERKKAEQKIGEREKEEDVRRRVEADVEMGLKKPGTAYLREEREGWEQGTLEALGR